MEPIEIVGVLAGLCSIASFIPQILKILREGDTSAVSLRMYVVTATGFSLWVAYGALLESWPIVVSNSLCLVLSSGVLGLKWHDAKKAAG